MKEYTAKMNFYALHKKSLFIGYLLWFFLGFISMHRLYAKDFKAFLPQFIFNTLGLLGAGFLMFLGLESLAGLMLLAYSFLLPLWLFIDLICIYPWIQKSNLALHNEIFNT